MTLPPRLLVVDDNEVDQERVQRLLKGDFTMSFAATGAEAIAQSMEQGFDCVLLDYRLPDMDGLAVLDALVERGASVVMLTGMGDERVAVDAMKRGAQDYLAKSELNAGSLRQSLRHAIESVRLRQRIEQQQKEMGAHVRLLDEQNQALREREMQMALLLDQLPATLWTTDAALRCLSVGGARDLFGGKLRKTAAIDTLLGAAPDSVLKRAHQSALGGKEMAFEAEHAGKWLRGRTCPLVDADGNVQGVIGVALDVSETKELTRQLEHAQKMEAVGQLAGGVAHDFNNLLTAMVGFTESIRDELPEDSPCHDSVNEVLTAAERGAGLVGQLLAFSRHRVGRPETLNLNTVSEGLVRMLRCIIDEGIELDYRAGPELWSVRADLGGLEQVIVNLVLNARDAMPDGGKILLSTANTSLDEHLALSRGASVPAGDYVVLAVTDTGVGIPDEIRKKVFDPFFTTKEVGKGTGLGLSTCYGIATQAGGGVALYSEVGHGTTIRVYLPRTVETQTEQTPETKPREDAHRGGSETILVIEDDPQVLRSIARTLRRHGYDVLTASDRETATDHARSRGSSIRLVMSDVVMPGGSGPEVVASLRAHLPVAGALFMSGYAPASIQQRFDLPSALPILEKPFLGHAMTDMVRRALDDPRATSWLDGLRDPAKVTI